MKTGRPCKLTQELADAIVEGVSSGLYVAQVALANDLHPDTVRNWVRRGLEENSEEPFTSFARRFAQADAAVEAFHIGRIRAAGGPRQSARTVVTVKSGEGPNGPIDEKTEVTEARTEPGDWRADAFFAERRWPKRWGAPKEGQASGQDSLSLPGLQDAAAARPTDLDELFAEPPPELEDALLRNKDAILKLLGVGDAASSAR